MALKTETPMAGAASGIDSGGAPARRRARESERIERRTFNPGGLLALGIAVAIGIAVGAVAERQHFRASRVVASVNGSIIDADTFFDRLQAAGGSQMIRRMVAENLQLQFAAHKGVAPTETEVESFYQKKNKDPRFRQEMAASHRSPSDIKNEIRMELAQDAVITQGISATAAEARKFYEINSDRRNPRARYYRPETSRVAVIITRTQEEGEAALRALHRGVGFDVVVGSFSQDTSKFAGGQIPLLQRGRSGMSKIAGLEEAIFKMKVGEISAPHQYRNAWWIIRCLDRQPEATVPFEDVSEECEIGAKLTKAQTNVGKINGQFADFVKQANIQSFWSQYSSAIRPEAH